MTRTSLIGPMFFLQAVFLLAFSSPVLGGVIERDWKIAGDGLLTYDDVNQREWLDLSESQLSQIDIPIIEHVPPELGIGGLFDGFTWARSEDVLALVESAGIDSSTLDFTTNELATKAITDLLSITSMSSDSKYSSTGAINELGPTPLFSNQLCASITFNQRTIGASGAGILIVAGIEGDLRKAGLMLYRQAVPEPHSLFLLASLLILISSGRFRYEYH